MIRLICGPKGTGKTKTILDSLNASVGKAKGDIVFITQKKFETSCVDFNVRVIYTEDYAVNCPGQMRGFIKGLFAGNSDIEYLYIDGLMRIVGADADLNDFFKDLIALEKEYKFNAIITITMEKSELPEFVQKYAD